MRASEKQHLLNSQVKKYGKNITLRAVYRDDGIPIEKLDNLLWFDVYEGYRRLGRYTLENIRIKFG